MPLCDLCRGLTPDAKQYKHHTSFDKLLTSAEQCELCHLLSSLLEKNGHRKTTEEYRATKDGKHDLVNDTSITISGNKHREVKADETPRAIDQLVVTCGPLFRQGLFEENEQESASTQRLGVHAEEGTEAAATIAPRPLPVESSSERSFQLIDGWISHCAQHHDQCQLGYVDGKNRVAAKTMEDMTKKLKGLSIEAQAPLPSRILDLGDTTKNDSIRLVETEGGEGLYAALSHCWGKIRPLITTKATLEQHKDNIAFEDLVKTFQDAVTIARRLGMRYLWIDSLCIMQDDFSDWEKEAALMGEVYRNAYVTIAAAASTNGEGGCFRPRELQSKAIKLPFRSPDGMEAGHWYVHEQVANYSNSVWRAPLQQRGWTLQERCLSRRIIHFADDQIYFECNKSLQYEDCSIESEHTFGYMGFAMLYFLAANKDPMYQLVLNGMLSLQWYTLIESFTSRSLTMEEDALPALSGIAHQMSNITGYSYAAGLWTGSALPDQLLWRVLNYDNGEANQRPKQSLAPSWSWASIKGRVLFSTSGSRPLEPGHTKHVLDVSSLKVDIQPLGKDPNGRVLSGTISVTGWLVPGIVSIASHHSFESPDYPRFASWFYRRKGYTAKYNLLVGYNFAMTADRAFWGAAAFDDKGEGLGDVVALLVKQHEVSKDSKPVPDEGQVASFFVLYLSPTGVRGNEFRRVGVGHLVQFEERELGAKTRITII